VKEEIEVDRKCWQKFL